MGISVEEAIHELRNREEVFVAYSQAILAHPPNTFWQEAACSLAEPSPGFTAKIVLPIPKFSRFRSGYFALMVSMTGASSGSASVGFSPAILAFSAF